MQQKENYYYYTYNFVENKGEWVAVIYNVDTLQTTIKCLDEVDCIIKIKQG